VLGVIKTMARSPSPRPTGRDDRRALVGTFLGVFLPMAWSADGRPDEGRVDEESSFYKIIQSVLVAHLHGNAARSRGNRPGKRAFDAQPAS